MFLEMTGGKHPLNDLIMGGRSPRARAAELINGSKLASVDERKRLAAGGNTAIQQSDDTMIRLVRSIDSYARGLRTRFDQQVDEPQRQAYAQLAKARFAAYGTSVYPDATFTLRLAFGTVRGFSDGAEQVAPWTTLGGAYKHAEAHASQAPFRLPNRWLERKTHIQADTPFNFVSTADIIGGNSGSPVVNRQGEIVGIIFDGNLPSLVLDFAYSDDEARAISVDAGNPGKSALDLPGHGPG